MAEPRLAEGQRVRVRFDPPEEHCRTPFYLRGKPGVILKRVGNYRNPSQLAFHKPGLPRWALYRVCFRHDQIWSDVGASYGDTIVADLYEHWLDGEPGDP